MPRVLVVDDDRAVRHLIGEAFADSKYEVIAAGSVKEAIEQMQIELPDVVLLDIQLPDASGLEAFSRFKEIDGQLPVIYITGSGTSDTAIEAMKIGAFDYLLKPLDLQQVFHTVEQAAEVRRLARVPVHVDEKVTPDEKVDQIVGRSTKMQDVFKAIGRVAGQHVTVLIRGESGTGKELVARAIYQHGQRRTGPFLAVNCAAIPEHLLESELFGHERGAFTGADRQRVGKFEQCNGGTLFLDEIGDMPHLLQSKILRLLQEQQFQRVGGSETIQTDVRIVAATHRDLEKMVADGDFREDLLYRLNGYTIMLPPLRERGDDLILLIQHYLAKLSRQLNRQIDGVSTEALEILRRHDWPGNIRELEGVLRQTLLQTTGAIIAPEFLPHRLLKGPLEERSQGPAAHLAAPLSNEHSQEPHRLAFDLKVFIESRLTDRSSDLYAETLEVMERYLLTQILSRANGNQSETSRILGITRGSLRHKIRSLGITIENTIDPGK